MPTLNEVTDFACANLEFLTISKNGTHFYSRCPMCGDSDKSKYKKRFHIQWNSNDDIQCNCFNCTPWSFYDVYGRVKGITSEEAYWFFNSYDPERFKNKLKSKKENQKIKKIKSEFIDCSYILKDCISLKDEPEGYIQKQFQIKLKEFVEKRKINQDLFVAYKGKFIGRIIIPIIEKDKIIYFQGRAIHEEMEPKYFNPSIYKQNIILNKNNFEKNKWIIAGEGLLDGFSVKNQGTCILGKELTEEFLNELNKCTENGIILAMDNDEDGIKKLIEYIEKFPRLKFFIMPDEFIHLKDLNDLLKYININDMYEFVVENSFSNTKAKYIIKLRRQKG